MSSPTLFESMTYSNTAYMTYYNYPALLSQGNNRFASLPTGTVKANLKRFESIVDVWSEQLSKRVYINNTSEYFDDLRVARKSSILPFDTFLLSIFL